MTADSGMPSRTMPSTIASAVPASCFPSKALPARATHAIDDLVADEEHEGPWRGGRGRGPRHGSS